MRYFFLVLYLLVFKYFPRSSFPYLGSLSMYLRYICCKNIFKKCGKNVNIERCAGFGNGFELEIGDNSGIGRNCHIPSNIIIGNDVMMAPHVFIFDTNHITDNIEIPIRKQGVIAKEPVVIGDDVWIGSSVLIMPGKKIANGCVIAAGTVLVKDFPPFSIIGGNPSKLIRSRK